MLEILWRLLKSFKCILLVCNAKINQPRQKHFERYSKDYILINNSCTPFTVLLIHWGLDELMFMGRVCDALTGDCCDGRGVEVKD